MNQGIRYYSPIQQVRLQYNCSNQYQQKPITQRKHQIQIERENQKNGIINYEEQLGHYQENKNLPNQNGFLLRGDDVSNQNHFQSKRDDFFIGNDFQDFREVIPKNNECQQEQDQIELKEQSQIAIEDQQQVSPIEQIIVSNTFLLVAVEFLIASILILIFNFQKYLQSFVIKEENDMHISYPCLIAFYITFFIMMFIFSVHYRFDRDQSKEINLAALISYTLTFQQTVIYYYLAVLIKLKYGYIKIQSSFFIVFLISLIIKFRPHYLKNIKKYYSIIIFSACLYVLFASIYFKNVDFWWIFGILVFLFFASLQLLIICMTIPLDHNSIYNNSYVYLIHIMLYIVYTSIITLVQLLCSKITD